MSISVKFRILLGFGLVLLMLLMSAGVSSFLISRINNNVSEFSGALGRKFAGSEMDLAMTKVRVRVNQWLRSLNPDFAKQADQLLAQSGELVAKVSAGTVTDTEKDNAAKVDRALKAYIESWHVIQGLYTDEAKLYADKIEAPTGKILVTLALARDAKADKSTQANHIIAKARDDFMTAEVLAVHYRGSPAKEDA